MGLPVLSFDIPQALADQIRRSQRPKQTTLATTDDSEDGTNLETVNFTNSSHHVSTKVTSVVPQDSSQIDNPMAQSSLSLDAIQRMKDAENKIGWLAEMLSSSLISQEQHDEELRCLVENTYEYLCQESLNLSLNDSLDLDTSSEKRVDQDDWKIDNKTSLDSTEVENKNSSIVEINQMGDCVDDWDTVDWDNIDTTIYTDMKSGIENIKSVNQELKSKKKETLKTEKKENIQPEYIFAPSSVKREILKKNEDKGLKCQHISNLPEQYGRKKESTKSSSVLTFFNHKKRKKKMNLGCHVKNLVESTIDKTKNENLEIKLDIENSLAQCTYHSERIDNILLSGKIRRNSNAEKRLETMRKTLDIAASRFNNLLNMYTQDIQDIQDVHLRRVASNLMEVDAPYQNNTKVMRVKHDIFEIENDLNEIVKSLHQKLHIDSLKDCKMKDSPVILVAPIILLEATLGVVINDPSQDQIRNVVTRVQSVLDDQYDVAIGHLLNEFAPLGGCFLSTYNTYQMDMEHIEKSLGPRHKLEVIQYPICIKTNILNNVKCKRFMEKNYDISNTKDMEVNLILDIIQNVKSSKDFTTKRIKHVYKFSSLEFIRTKLSQCIIPIEQKAYISIEIKNWENNARKSNGQICVNSFLDTIHVIFESLPPNRTTEVSKSCDIMKVKLGVPSESFSILKERQKNEYNMASNMLIEDLQNIRDVH